MKPLRDQIAEAVVHTNLVSHSLAFPIADVVLRVVGNGTIKALQEENARLHDAISNFLNRMPRNEDRLRKAIKEQGHGV